MASYYSYKPSYVPYSYSYPNGHWAPPQIYQATPTVYPTYVSPMSPPTTVPVQPSPTSTVIPLAHPTSRTKSNMPNPTILPPNSAAMGVPVMLPGVLNSTFTPTSGVVPLMASDNEEDDSDTEPPIVPTLNLTPPPSAITYTYTRSRGRRNLTPPPSPIVYAHSKCRSQRSHSRGRARSHSASRPTTYHTYPVTNKVCCDSRHCDGHHCKAWRDFDSLILSDSSGSSAASSSSASSYSPQRRRRSSESRHHREEKRPSWRDYYPEDIYDSHSKPEVHTVRPAHPPPIKTRKTYFYKKPKPFTIQDWADKAASLAPLTQSQAKHFYPDGVELHPLLDKDTTTLFFGILDPKRYVTLQDGSSIVPLESHHATSPPLIKMEIVNFHEGSPIVLESPNGITLGEVVDAILRSARATVPNREVRKWSEGRLGIVYQWHWYHRSRVAGMRTHLTVGDTFGGHTAFEGMMTAQKAKSVDDRARGISHCTMVLCLGMDGFIPGLRPLSDFPR